MSQLYDKREEFAHAPREKAPTPDEDKDVMQVVPAYRGPAKEDMGFLLNTWLNTVRVRNKHVPADLFFTPLKRIIARTAQDAHVLIACDRDEPDYILAYAVADPLQPPAQEINVHFSYTKRNFRRMGLQKELISKLGYTPGMQINASFQSHYTHEVMRNRSQPIVLNPFYFARYIK